MMHWFLYSQHLCGSAQCGCGSPNDRMRKQKNSLDKTTWSQPSSRIDTLILLHQHHHYSTVLPCPFDSVKKKKHFRRLLGVSDDVENGLGSAPCAIRLHNAIPNLLEGCEKPKAIADGNTVRNCQDSLTTLYHEHTKLPFGWCCVRSWNRLLKRMEMTVRWLFEIL